MQLRAPFVMVCLQAALACANVQAQASPSPAPQTPTLRTQSTLVLVPTLVKTKAGVLVYTLAANDFTITDNGVEQKVALEEDTGEQPLALVVVVETGGAGGRELGKYSDLGAMVEAVVGNVPHQVALVGFDSKPALLQDFTPDLGLVGHAIGDLRSGDRDAAILDALAFSVDLLRAQPSEYRRAVLLISETVDHGSQAKLADALREIGDTNTAIYSLAFPSSRSGVKHEASKLNSDTPGPSGGCMSKDAATSLDESRMQQAWDCLSMLAPPLRAATMAGLLAMNGLRRNTPQTVAHLTGGEYFGFNNNRSLERGLLAISNHVPNRYVLSFHPQSPQPGIHAIEVHLKNYPDLVVTARSSYWANSQTAVDPRSWSGRKAQ